MSMNREMVGKITHTYSKNNSTFVKQQKQKQNPNKSKTTSLYV